MFELGRHVPAELRMMILDRLDGELRELTTSVDTCGEAEEEA